MARYKYLWNANAEIDRLRDEGQELGWELYLARDIVDVARKAATAQTDADLLVHLVSLRAALARHDSYKAKQSS